MNESGLIGSLKLMRTPCKNCNSTRASKRGDCADCQNTRAKRFAAKQREELIALLGGKCIRCGFDDPRAMQIDHVYGDGRKERTQKYKSNYSYYVVVKELVIAGTDRYQLLCANCNQIKKVENNEVARNGLAG